MPRWGFQQVLKRVPFQIRPLLGIRKGYNPVTLALVLQAYVYRSLARNQDYNDDIAFLVSELTRLASPGYSGYCWGYDFDWEAQYAIFPSFSPTVVATGFVTNALFEAYSKLGIEAAGDLLVKAVPFLLKDLNRITDGECFCWSYSPGDNCAILNATMKGARLCAQAYTITKDKALNEVCLETIPYVVKAQASDGSWPYSVGDTRTWRDNFHTGYLLDCLDDYEILTGDTQFAEAKYRGWDYYRRNFFTDDQIPKYFDSELYPIDATACAQSLLTVDRFGDTILRDAIVSYCLDNLALPYGAFKYQIYRHYEIRIPYMRWSVAWLFLALSRTELSLAKATNGN